ncbi:SpaH/EbpB family LPXTG-anchored major pilin [Corynebacterium sp. H130]|uniref:SpaH/EbpB family LPXTG-anchored major pilin n=1 Tax=Corynebacterium sp. H130 TaxID=3133444 RepID=UPI00309D9FBD
MTKVGISRRIAAVMAAGALVFGGAFVDMPAAGAQAGTETPLPTAAPAPAGTIDPAHTVSLTINKYLGEPGNTSTPIPDSPEVKFRIEKVSVDLTTQDGWTALAGMTAANAPIDSAFNAVELSVSGGKAVISTTTNSQFTVGVYRVTELTTAGYTTAAPFLVTLPYSGTDGAWTYDQVVNPKNQNVQPNKQANDNQAQLGGTMSYTINAPVPAGAMDRFNIVDELVANLALKTGTVKVSAVGTAAPALTAGTDYKVSETGNTVRVDFTRTGLDKLEAARKDDPTLQVSVAFDATVQSIPASGTIVNTATVELPNNGTVTTDVPVDGTNPSGPTSTTYGDLTITKTGGTSAEMAGAQFQVYLCQPDPNNAGKYQLLGSPLTLATAADGTATNATLTVADNAGTATANAYGLPASSFSGGATGNVTNTYCALETKAPTGFARDPEPRVLSYDSANRKFTVTVNNVKDSIIGQLPATGAWGIVLIFIIGGALLARGLYTSYKDNKQTA